MILDSNVAVTAVPFQHKPGCIWEHDHKRIHRVPVDCVTVPDLLAWLDQARVEALGAKEEAEMLRRKILLLKVTIYDLEHPEEEVR
jgi:hypothetical protein